MTYLVNIVINKTKITKGPEETGITPVPWWAWPQAGGQTGIMLSVQTKETTNLVHASYENKNRLAKGKRWKSKNKKLY